MSNSVEPLGSAMILNWKMLRYIWPSGGRSFSSDIQVWMIWASESV